MDIGSIFLILALLVLVGLFISRPLFEHKATSISQEEHDLSTLMAERDRILDAIEELDFDHSLGKIPSKEYPALRSTLLKYGADVLQRLDAPQEQTGVEQAEDRLEAAIANRRAALTPTPARAISLRANGGGGADDDLEALIASRRRARQEKSAGFCPKCGNPLQRSDSFCPRCGAPLT